VRISLASKVMQDRSPEDVIETAGRLGYGGVEWFCLPQHLPPETTAARAGDLAARTRDAGLATVCLSTYVGGFVEADDAECARQLTLLDRYLELAARLDCPVLRVWPDMMGRTLREPVPADARARAADWMGRATERAAGVGRTLGVEMHLTIGADVELLLGLFDAVDRPNLGAIYDPGNLHLARRPYGPETIARLAGRIVHVQLKDASRSRPTPPHLADEPTLRFGGDFDLLTGEGEIDFGPLLRAFAQIAYRGWYSVECHAQPRPGLDSAGIAAAEIEALRRLAAVAS
jgi:sugar phosphate isomerase/epimerase